MPAPARRQRATYHHGDLVNEIRRVALRLVDELGGPAFTLRQIASEVGVAHGAIYSHFKDRQALLDDLAVFGLAQLHDAQRKRASTCEHGLAELAALYEAYIEFARHNPGAYRLIFNGMYVADEASSVNAARRSGASVMLAAIERAQAQKLVQQVDVGLLAFTLWSAAHGFADLLISHHVEEFPAAEKDLHQSMHFAMRAALYGVTTPKGRAWLNRSAP